MNDNERKNGGWVRIAGGIALIVVLFLAIQFVFRGLEQAIPQTGPGEVSSTSASRSVPDGSEAEGPGFCIHCGEKLPESFQWGQFCPWCGKKVA